jgi:ABC-2 type transport system ATP-binding protein
LKLVNELGRDHGKSIILSTHLLADVQAVCEHVVILAGGKVRGHGPVNELCAVRNDRFRLRIQGDPNGFRNELEAAGVAFLPDTTSGDWRVSVPSGWTNLAFFQRANAHRAIIRTLVRDDETLEEFFLRSVNGDSALRSEDSASRLT